MISADCLLKIKEVDIIDVIGKFVKLKVKRGKGAACCPFHNEKTPSFSVNREKGIYKCFGCGAAGDAIEFVKNHERVDFFKAIEIIADIGYVTLEFDKNIDKEAYQKKRADQTQHKSILNYVVGLYQELLWQPGSSAMDILMNERLWKKETIGLWKLGFSPDQWRFITPKLAETGQMDAAAAIGLVKIKDTGNNIDVFKNRIIFPIQNEFGEIIGLGGRVVGKEKPKYINSSDSDLYRKSSVLYGLYQAKKGISQKGFAVLVEGYADVISFHQAGMDNTVCSCGTAFTTEQARLLKKHTDSVTIVPDNDPAGMEAAAKTLDLLWAHDFKARILIITEEVPGQKVDPDDLAKRFFTAEEVEVEVPELVEEPETEPA